MPQPFRSLVSHGRTEKWILLYNESNLDGKVLSTSRKSEKLNLLLYNEYLLLYNKSNFDGNVSSTSRKSEKWNLLLYNESNLVSMRNDSYIWMAVRTVFGECGVSHGDHWKGPSVEMEWCRTPVLSCESVFIRQFRWVYLFINFGRCGIELGPLT